MAMKPFLRRQSTLVQDARQQIAKARAKVEAKNLYFYLKQNSDDVSTTQELSIIFQILVANRVGVQRFRQVVPRNPGRASLARKLSKASIGSDDLEDVFLQIDEPKKILSSSATIVVIEIKAPEFVLEGIYRAVEEQGVIRADGAFNRKPVSGSFPRSRADLCCVKEFIDLAPDHPGSKDAEYVTRRRMINDLVRQNSHSLPTVSYTDEEELCWRTIYSRLQKLWPTYACSRFQEGLKILEESGVVKQNQIPNLQQVSDFLEETTGFILKPASGLCSARDFLNCLAMKAFPCTLYMRHHSEPGYSPEPDLVHEILGHLLDDVAEFTQKIGLASLVASDEEIEELARLYWYSVEFGLTLENGDLKVFGAGLLSSPDEMEYAVTDEPNHPLSVDTAMDLLRVYCQALKNPVVFSYNEDLGNHQKIEAAGLFVL
ncbi:Oidioi.mRNA.OKI2018_I69.PAR.g10040.t1.cds [Oikopleura dioica]|uniref:phenylalanine 4-monooxygenase n=1 Tax=Oikopleura dioica TaxID=34765 RepID=A0ABN7RS68_OIKDI|nr:Oidioi.mRNA.OKI2018_I69.PAR.g10040.t1.cds [Oikopleura dioica]